MYNFKKDTLIYKKTGGDGLFSTSKDGVVNIYTTADQKADFIEYENHKLVYVKSSFGHPAIYPLKPVDFRSPAKAVLMDLDGTSVKSEKFWMWVIEQSIAKLAGNRKFQLEDDDEPYVSGHSVSEHLQYCIDKYCPGRPLQKAREYYFKIVHFEMGEILQGRGRTNAFEPCEGLKEFLLELKMNKIKIGLVTSGLFEKAYPEILSAFKVLNMGDPLDFYDSIITAGYPLGKGKCGTLGELSPKPHPWLYAETAKVGLGLASKDDDWVIGLEDSSAGVLSVRLAGYPVIGLVGGNIEKSGVAFLTDKYCQNLLDALPYILGGE